MIPCSLLYCYVPNGIRHSHSFCPMSATVLRLFRVCLYDARRTYLSSPHVHAEYYTILCLLLYAIPRQLIVVYWPHTLTHPLASLSSVTTYFISSNLSIVVFYIAIHPSSILPPTCISNQTETYSFFESTTKAYPLYHWCDVLIWYCNTCILTSPITYVCCSI